MPQSPELSSEIARLCRTHTTWSVLRALADVLDRGGSVVGPLVWDAAEIDRAMWLSCDTRQLPHCRRAQP